MMWEGIPLAGLTAPALVSIFVLLFFTGGVVSRPVYKEKCAESERWRLAYENERNARSAADAQTAELLEVTKTSQMFIKAVFHNSERIRESGVPDEITTS